MKYILSIDQSTQGTKALLLDETGNICCRADMPHRQIIDEKGWVSHDAQQIYENTLLVIREAIRKASIDPAQIACMGISNQRETTVVWDSRTGEPVCDAIVWQCSRATAICDRVLSAGYGPVIHQRTGIPASPYFPAAKMAWILQNIGGIDAQQLCFGTIDTWLVWKLTGAYKTDFSNASRTQLFNIHTLSWDADICRAFGIPLSRLPQVCDSDALFGYTDLGGLLQTPIPVHAVMGDSHAALFGQGCTTPGMAKATYGTGSSVMMNVGPQAVMSKNGLVSSLAWKHSGVVNYVLEGNINYTGAVISWLKDDVKLIGSAAETEALARAAHPDDKTYLVPAFTGLGAPYWRNDASAMISGMSRLTGNAELVRAALDCIVYQITDIVRAMEQDTGLPLESLRCDGGPTKNGYLMQLQSDILGSKVEISQTEELSACGAAFMAGIACGIWDETIQSSIQRNSNERTMDPATAQEKYSGWKKAVETVCR